MLQQCLGGVIAAFMVCPHGGALAHRMRGRVSKWRDVSGPAHYLHGPHHVLIHRLSGTVFLQGLSAAGPHPYFTGLRKHTRIQLIRQINAVSFAGL